MNQPTAAICRQDQSVLVVVDVQTRLMAAMQSDTRDRVVNSVKTLLRAASALDIPTVITEQYPRGLGHSEPTVLQNKPSVCEVLEKTSFSVCGVDRFNQLLAMSGRNQVVMCGVEAHVCILQSALQLHLAGIDVFVVADAVCSRTDANRENALARMQFAGITLASVESIVFEWLGDSKHPAFKDVSALIQ